MGCFSALFSIILPRFALLVGWYNNPNAWNALYGSQLLFGLGWLAIPWTTLIYGFVAPNGMSLLNWIFVLLAFLLDIGTYGLGFFGGRKQYSSYRGT